ncbi:hypothetical protein ACFYZE_01210 [Streptomyces sp. NPDC001796]|uniref:hypothetical protein n=1 Tax=Streptomyces sp. NPDC001796 TaxID=3364609 RepID=UPI0036A8421E
MPSQFDVNASGAQGVLNGDNNTQNNQWIVVGARTLLTVVLVTAVAAVGTLVFAVYDKDARSKASPSETPFSQASSSWKPESAPTTDSPAPSEQKSEATPEDSEEPVSESPSPTAFDVTTLDDEATDGTPATPSALLAASFTDSKGVKYTRRSQGVHSCAQAGRSAEVRATLARLGCSGGDIVTGSYIDAGGNIMVSAVVVPFADKGTAGSAYQQFKNTPTGDWSYWCPLEGTGSAVCRDSDALQATQFGYTSWKHRYLIRTVALYIDLRQDNGVLPWLVAASNQGCVSAGPDNYPANR